MTPNPAIARRIRGLMGEHRESQSELGAAVGLSQVAISRRLRGRVPFSADQVLRIARHYAVPVSALLEGIEDAA